MSKQALISIAGAAAAPFTGGASLAIAAGINAATQVYGAKKASDSAKTAAKIQTASADKAIDLQRQMYGEQQQRMSPYVNAGSQALQTLGQLGSRPTPMFNALQPGGGFNPQSFGAMTPPQGQTVKMIGPDGRPRDVPQAMVQQALAAGGRMA